VKKSSILKISNSELSLISLLNELDQQYNNGEYHKVVSRKIEIFDELYSKQDLDEDYFPRNLGNVWTDVIGHEALIGALQLCAKYGLVHKGVRNLEVLNSQCHPTLLSKFVSFTNIQYSDFKLLDFSNYPSQFYKYENFMLWRTKNSFEDQYSLLDQVFTAYNLDKRNLEFDFSDNEEEFFLNKLEDFGLPKGSWFVVLHVKEVPKNENNRRSASVANFEKSCQYITSQGGWIIQIGFAESTKINLTSNYIDLRGKSQNLTNLHIFVLAKAKFILGTMTGLNVTASLFKTPCLITNSVTLGRNTLNFNPQTRYLPKTVYSKKYKQNLSFKQILETPEGFGELNVTDLDINSLYLLENSSEQIYKATVDILSDLIDGGQKKVLNLELLNNINLIRNSFSFASTGMFAESYLLDFPEWLASE
jgi:putative glycosyltransferase (TIGR04372 family)